MAETYEAYLHRYLYHPESKSLSPSGRRCGMLTFGLLGRMHIIAGRRRRFGKEVDRRWEEGDVLEAARHRPIEYERASSRAGESLIEPSLYLSRLVKGIGIRKLNRQGFGRRILEKISRRQLVKSFDIARIRARSRAIRSYNPATEKMRAARLSPAKPSRMANKRRKLVITNDFSSQGCSTSSKCEFPLTR